VQQLPDDASASPLSLRAKRILAQGATEAVATAKTGLRAFRAGPATLAALEAVPEQAEWLDEWLDE
jgi:hypothetical protein